MGGVRMGSLKGLSARAGAAGLVSLLALTLALASAPSAGAVTGGTQIPITDAPWQVEIVTLGEGGLQYCGGAIISDRLVLTAAHCVENSVRTSLVAGDSDYLVGGPTQQAPEVKGIRIDPRFKSGGSQPSADDVALLELETALSFGAGSVEPIALVRSGSQWPEGTGLEVTGYGQHKQKRESTPNEALYSLATTLLSGEQCGGEAGAFLCTRASGGTTCFGDSGSGLTVPGTIPTLIGLVDRAEPSSGEECKLPATDSYVNLAAPAIQQFIGTIPSSEGAPKAPPAPQQEATPGTHRSSVGLAARKLSVSRGSAVVKLDCTGAASCRGKLTLTVVETVKVKGKRRKKTVTLGAVSFTIAGGRAGTIKIKLSSYGRAQVKATHGRLKASLAIVGIETEPTHKRTESVTIS